MAKKAQNATYDKVLENLQAVSKKLLKEKNMSYRELSILIYQTENEAGNLYKILNKQQNPTLKSLILIFEGLNSVDKLGDVFKVS